MKIELQISKMSCVSCAQNVERALMKCPGVKKATVHFSLERAFVEGGAGIEQDLIRAVEGAGYGASLAEKGGQSSFWSDSQLVLCICFAAPFLLHMIGVIPLVPIVQLGLASLIQFYFGARFYRSAFYALKALSTNMDVLVALGTSAAYGFSLTVMILGLDEALYFETSAVIITLILLGNWIEGRSKKRARGAIEALIKKRPKEVMRREGKTFVSCLIEEVHEGDILLIRPGDLVPVDGKVLKGTSSVDESMLTGESAPIYKESGKKLFSGTTVLDGSLEMEAQQVGEKTMLAAMIRLVEEAQQSKAPIQRLADQVSAIFVPIVVVISLCTFATWVFFSGSFEQALIAAVSVLVIACPCALGLATPTVILVASGLAAEMGMLFRRAEALEVAESIQTLLLDKTGTLTEGKPHLAKVISQEGFSEDRALSIATALAKHSKHPLSEGIVKGGGGSILVATEFVTIPGKGVKGSVEGENYSLGSLVWAEEEGVDLSNPEKGSVVVLWQGDRTCATFYLEDTLRPHAKEMVSSLYKMGIEPVIISGDREETVKALAEEIGAKSYAAGVLPEEKVRAVQGYQPGVGMVGDGINDAAALSAADVSFAIDTAADVTLESADILLLGGDLMGIPRALSLSKKTFQKIRQNLGFAFLYNSLAIPFAAMGLLNPMLAAGAMALSSLSVVGNALILRRLFR